MLQYGANLVNESTNFTSRTFGTWTLSGPRFKAAEAMYVFLSAIYTGGSTDTVILVVLETSADGSVWHQVKAASLTSSSKTAESYDAAVHLMKYVRVRLVASGTAPGTFSIQASLGGTAPFTLTTVS